MDTNRIRTPSLEIAYEEHGDPNAPSVILAHGFPDDVRTWDRVVPALVDSGLRALAPYTRGFGATKFLGESVFRTGQIAALAKDIVDFADSLKMHRFLLIGHDWGARAAYGVAALWPERVQALVTLSVGYGTSRQQELLSFEQARAYWYQWYFALDRGRRVLESNRKNFCRMLWRTWSPSFQFDEAEYDATTTSFENPDFVEVAIHSYRHRWGLAPGDPLVQGIQSKLDDLPLIRAPTIMLHGAEDGATLPETSEGRERYFVGGYERTLLAGVGHFVQGERPDAVIKATLALASRVG